jgi:hypothetical protein
MPFVFVHGVSNRAGTSYERERTRRNTFLKEIVAPAVGIDPQHEIFAPYWGREGVRFWRDLEVVPRGNELEVFGSDEELPPSLGFALQEKQVSSGDGIKEIAQRHPEVVIDLLFDAAAAQAQSEEDFRELARAYNSAQGKLAGNAGSQWLTRATDDNVADIVFRDVRPTTSEEQFGGNRLWDMLATGAELAKRQVLKVPDLLSHAGVGLVRKPLTEKIGLFIGDAFRYLAERGDGTRPGPIASLVLEDLQRAHEVATRTSEPLIVVCHSFGGEIVYDILTRYAEGSDLQVDTWVTVGSQVGLFEEMSLLLASEQRDERRGNEAIPSPRRARRWINIVDTNDVLGFIVLPVFTAAEPGTVLDFKYDTGYPVTGAHSGYFEWPSFYKRMKHRIS